MVFQKEDVIVMGRQNGGVSTGTALLIIFLAIVMLLWIFNVQFQAFLIQLFSQIQISLLSTFGGINGGFGTDQPEGTLPQQYDDCTDYDFNYEFTRYFGTTNMQALRDGCTGIGGTFTSVSNEVGCDYPATVSLDCTNPDLRYFESFCNYLHGTYICDNNLYHYVGCLCNKLPNQEQQQPEDEEEEQDVNCGIHVNSYGYNQCYGTCPEGKECKVLQDTCACFEPEEEEQYGGIGTVFVTKNKWSGAMGGLSGMDEKCQVSSNSAGLSGTWRAIASDSANGAWTRIPDTAYYLLNGNKIANNKADLFDGTILTALNVDEYGNKVDSEEVWTGTDLAGNAYGSGDPTLNCHSWSWVSDGYFGIVGNTGSNGIGWIENTVVKECKLSAHIYCIRVN